MSLPDSFTFSQSSLQDYIDCRRRFQLRYLLQVAWPAIQAEPIQEFEKHIQRGERFHRLVQQWLLGVPEDKLSRFASQDEDEHLHVWWDHFQSDILPSITGARFVEVTLTTPIGSYNLAAKYDLILIQPGQRIVIYDWKTNSRRPTKTALLERMQTRVYLFLLAQAGSALSDGAPVSPEQIEMVYWFADPSMPSERILYSKQRYEEDRSFLAGLIQEIETLTQDDYFLTSNLNHCKYCVYRSLCNRGIKAADYTEEDDIEIEEQKEANLLDFSLDQISEIGF